MNGKPNKKQSDFHEWCRENIGCVVSGADGDSIHHIKGAKMKLKGVQGFAGEWYVLSLSYWCHQDGKNPAALHVNRKEFEKRYYRTEKELWLEIMSEYKLEYGCYPMTDEEYQIIKDRG